MIINKVLSIDIGGSSIKAAIIDGEGNIIEKFSKLPTPQPAGPGSVLETIGKLTKDFSEYDAISAGFPGYVRDGIVHTAPNLEKGVWHKIPFAKMLSEKLGKPAQVVNDADMQGLGIVSGVGLEMMITLGTGFGTALLKDGVLLPHLELAHHPITKKKTYDQYIGDVALDAKGEEKWNKRMERVLQVLKTVFNYDRLYIGGGNAKLLTFHLDDNITIVSNKEAIDGGVKLWVEKKSL
jgi:polyphosphate glucokinase